MKQVIWGIIGTGRIAGTFATALANSKTGHLSAVASRSPASAKRFAEEHGVPRSYGSYEELLGDEEVEAVYISTPHPMHVEWTVKAARAGKHILCEKPLTLNLAEAMVAVEAARENDVFLMEAFMYRCHPQTARLAELIRSGKLGELKLIEATFSFKAPMDPESRLFSLRLGGGGILDVGCYCTSIARLIAGAAMGQPFAEPIDVKGSAHIGEVSRVDEYACAIMTFPADIIAVLSTGVGLAQENRVRIYGTGGRLDVPNFWAPGKNARMVFRQGGKTEEITTTTDRGVYALEADTVAEYLEKRQAPQMSWEDSLGNMRSLDSWREAVGLTYESERLDADRRPVGGGPLEVRRNHHMRYGSVEGVPRQVSRLVLGVDHQKWLPHAFVMFDEYFERGGNCFDTAYQYWSGICEKLLGSWIRQRGVRDRVVIIDKGAHSPYCTPEHAVRQLEESLDRLDVSTVDIYFLHRDNPDIPVGEFVDVLNEQKRLGRIGIFGGSNWSLERVRQANAYAEERGLEGFSAVSNNFSLAEMVQPVWPGCCHAWDPEYRRWLEETRTPLFPWSSQARGFFTDRADKEEDPELFDAWFSDDNLERRSRAIELAAKKKVRPIEVALAYVLQQPFATFALIGPRSVQELKSSLRALDIELSKREMDWLNLEEKAG